MRTFALCAILTALAAFLAGCSDVGYNPYVQNDSHKPIGKVIDSVPDAAGDGLNELDARFENWFY